MIDSPFKHDSLVNKNWRKVVYCNNIFHILVDNLAYASWWLSHSLAWGSNATGRLGGSVPRYRRGKVTLDKEGY